MSDSHHHDHSGHSHGDHDDAHDHSDEIEPALQTLLWKQIEFDKIITLNESQSDAGAKVVEKTCISLHQTVVYLHSLTLTGSQRLNSKPRLISDADEQLLMTVP